MSRLQELCHAVRILSDHGQIVLHGVPGKADLWVCFVQVGSVILATSSEQEFQTAIDEVSVKVRVMAEKMQATIRTGV